MDGNGKIEIEKGVPVPCDGRGAPKKYPFREMAVGDSFLVPRGGPAESSCRRLASDYGKKLNRRYTVRIVSDGFRIWRVE